MAIVTIFSASYCSENDIATTVAEKLGYELINTKLAEKTSAQFKVALKKIHRTLQGYEPFLNNITHEKEKNIAYLKATLAQLFQKDQIVYHGTAGHLLPPTISHVLKVCIVANQDYRIDRVKEIENIADKEAKELIQKEDKQKTKWIQNFHNLSPWDEQLYDIVIPVHSTSVMEAVDIIAENTQKEVLRTTKESQQAMNDFYLAARVNVPLVENGYDVDVASDGGNLTISLKEYVIRLEHIRQKIIKIVNPVPGVKNVEVVMASDVKVPSRYDELKAPPRFLLVDDEKEYVQTLSQRLQVRNVESAIAYDGQEALDHLKKEESDVMVLDLKMPGIDGMEVLRKVKKKQPHVEVIILTGHGSEKDKRLAMELGAFAYLEKPVDIDVLTKTMKEAYKKINK